MTKAQRGALSGIRVVELAGIGPAPFAAMLLADHGADVIRVDRAHAGRSVDAYGTGSDLVNRGKRSVALDLKHPLGRDAALSLIAAADVLLEGYRPGVAEGLGLGPDACFERNPRLVYGRMTGWGQEGPLARVAGHDIDYVALTGALWAIGRADEKPTPPLNMLGDYAGGSMFLLLGVLAALIDVARSGQGQVVDAAMVDGTSVLTTMFTALAGMDAWDLSGRACNTLDTAAPWYDVYECADGKWVAVGAIEPQFYAQLVEVTGFRAGTDESRFVQGPRSAWPAEKAEWAAHWRTRTRDEWAALLSGTDACVQPVLSWEERAAHPHHTARGTYVTVDGVSQAAPAPRLSRTPAARPGTPPETGEHTREVLAEVGLDPDELLAAGAASAACGCLLPPGNRVPS